MTRLAALATAAEQALADEAARGPEAGALGVARAAFEHRLARMPEDTEAAARLAEFLPDDLVKLDTLAEAARDPGQRLPDTADPLLRTILQPGPAAARYAALEQLPDVRLGAAVGLRLRLYSEAGDAEGLARLREMLQTAWHGPAAAEELPIAARQGLSYRVVGRIAPWLTELDRGLAQAARAGFRQPAAERALAAALGDPVRAAKLVEDDRQRLEALLRAGGRERFAQALEAARTMPAGLGLLWRISPGDDRAERFEERLVALLDEAPGAAAEEAGWLAVGLAAARAEAGRFAEAEELARARLVTIAHRRAARTAIESARWRRSVAPQEHLAGLAAELEPGLRDAVVAALLPEAIGCVDPNALWELCLDVVDPETRIGTRIAILDGLAEAGEHELARALWQTLPVAEWQSHWPWMRARWRILGWRLGSVEATQADAWGDSWFAAQGERALAVLSYAAGGRAPLPREPAARSLARLGRGELRAALQDGLRAPGEVFGFPGPPVRAWCARARRAAPEAWGELFAQGWLAALGHPTPEAVADPLFRLPAQRLGDRVNELATARAVRYRAAVREAVERAIVRVGQGTANRPRSRPR